jgi:predicted dehydrogenase
VGCGHIAGVHVRAWKSTGTCEIEGVYDINQDSARAFADRFGIPRVFDRVDVLADGVDIVDDCSPPAVHVSVALEAVGKGKDYLVEKPMVLSSSDLDGILELQRSSGSRICVIHNLKYNLGVRAARRWVDEGRIGKLLSLERHFLTDPTTDRMLRGENHWSHRLPGGRWVETLPHELYLVYHFMGPLDVEHVQSLRLRDSPHPHTADEMMVTLQGEDGVASLRFSARCRSNLRTLTLFGSEGTIRVELLAGTAVLFKPRTRKWVRGVGLDTLNAAKTLARMIPDRFGAVSTQARRETAHARLIRDYARHLVEGGPAPVSLEEIEYVVRTGEEISRQAAAETFVRGTTIPTARAVGARE